MPSPSSLVKDLFDNKAELAEYNRERQRRLVVSDNALWHIELKEGGFLSNPPSEGLAAYLTFEHLVFYLTILFLLYHFCGAFYTYWYKYDKYVMLHNVEQRSHLARVDKRKEETIEMKIFNTRL